MDRRLTPWNGRVAQERLRGQVDAERFVPGVLRRVVAPLADLCAGPGGPRDRQLPHGAAFLLLEEVDGHGFGQALRDGYVGWVAAAALGPAAEPTHWLCAPASHLYPAPDLKRPAACALPLNALLRIVGGSGDWAETDLGRFVPRAHLRALDDPAADPVAVAESLLGTPYLWGGNSREGIDCSGLVQVALHACGHDCPGDSDLQSAGLGRPLDPAAPLRRGDLVFWRGHVGWMADGATLLHANAHHMAVAREPLATARARIAAAGGGPVIALRRPLPG